MLDEKTIGELKQTHGDRLIAVEADGDVTLVFRAPREAEYNRFIDSVNGDVKGAKTSGTFRELFVACCVHPPIQEMRTILTAQPGLILNVVPKLNEMVGAGDSVDVKKL